MQKFTRGTVPRLNPSNSARLDANSSEMVPPPYPTIYVGNLNERVKIPDLVYALQAIFEEFGIIIDIVAKRSLKRRGQAFVVFEKQESAQRAMELDGFELHDKPLRIRNAYQPSDKTVETRFGEEALEEHKKRRIAQKEYRMAAEQASKESARRENELKRPGEPAEGERKSKVARGLKSTAGTSSNVIPDEYLPPNRILFVQNIPEGYNIDNLSNQFSVFEGFKEFRPVPGRTGIAFVEYAGEIGAIAAKERMGNKVLPGTEDSPPLKVTYQRQ